MYPLLSLIALTNPSGSGLKVNDVLFASEAQLLRIVGVRDPSAKREFGLAYLHPGYTKVWVDAAGPGMKQARFCLGRFSNWKEYLTDLGLNASHATVRHMDVAVSPVPLLRNKVAITGVTGLPTPRNHKSWNVTFVEYAVANKARLRKLKSQITAAPVGEPRLRLIRSCYDWWSELELSQS